jgi:hypothetical protein
VGLERHLNRLVSINPNWILLKSVHTDRLHLEVSRHGVQEADGRMLGGFTSFKWGKLKIFAPTACTLISYAPVPEY